MKKELDLFLYELTSQIHHTSLEKFSAVSIAAAISLKRSTVSSYLNQGVREGKLLKIKDYPVLFLHKQALIDLQIEISSKEYFSVKELLEISKNPLEEVIGANGSLKEAIDQIKTAVLYPNGGLPILLIGASGSGKTFLAEKIYRFAVEEKVVDKNAPFISYNCAQYYNNPELLSSALFGYVKGAFTGAETDQSGLLEKADGGYLFLDEVHRLSEEGQEKLFTFMDTGEYSPMGDNSIRKKASIRLVFATTENIQSTFLPTFLRRLPVTINLPKFQNRPKSERIHLIDTFFLKESHIFSKDIEVSHQVIDFLLDSDLEGNVGKIKNIIKYTCGSAYVHHKNSSVVTVRLGDLPLEYTLKFKEQFSKPAKKSANRRYLLNADQQVPLENQEVQELQNFFDQMMSEFSRIQTQATSAEFFIESMIDQVTKLMDKFVFQDIYDKEQTFYSVLVYHIRQTFKYMNESFGVELDGNLIFSIANYLYLKDNHHILSGNQPIENKIEEFMDLFLADAYWYAKKMLTHLSAQLDRDVFPEDIFFIAFYFYSLHISNISSEIKSIVLAHGYSTASSMANVVNRMLGKNIFHAYDMPIDISLEKVETQIIRYINDNRTDAGLILLVDMGSFKQLGEKLTKYLKGPLLLIDFVSTPLVLEIGQKILAEQTIMEISEEIKSGVAVHKQLFLPEFEKKKAIVTCCYTGIGSAIQIQEVLEKCLGKVAKELMIMPYDFRKLRENKNYETPFQLYDVLMIVGTEDPQIKHTPYIGLDQLINGNAISEFVDILSDHFPIENEEIKNELIFNFSLNKIVENLTILDAKKLLKFVKKAVSEMASLLNRTFSNNQLFLLYLHCCCMIERILRKEEIDEQEDIAAYIQRERIALQLIHKAFSEIENEYIIKISDLELRLLHEIVKN